MTPDWCVRAIWSKLTSYDSCLDPCAGEGGILRSLQELDSRPLYYGIEIDATRAQKCVNKGFRCPVADSLRTKSYPTDWAADLIITNPPYALALEFLEKALASDAKQVCFLLRLNFLGSQRRAAFWKKNPCDVYVLPKRPSFAIFLSCKKHCGWKASHPAGTEVIETKCPQCGADVSKCTSDATEYAWFVWRVAQRDRGHGIWKVLDV